MIKLQDFLPIRKFVLRTKDNKHKIVKMALLKAAIITVTPFQQNCSVIWKEDTKIAAVNDPGGDLETIEKFIEDQGLTLSKIFITHGHLDHAAGARELADKFNVDIEGPQIEDEFLTSVRKRVDSGLMKIGVAHSMLMAGVYYKNTDDKLQKFGFNDRDLVEHQGPERAAKDMINMIKTCRSLYAGSKLMKSKEKYFD